MTVDLALLNDAVAARAHLIDAEHKGAVRLFAGFYEGAPELAVDLYGKTLLFHDHTAAGDEAMVRAALDAITRALPFVTSAVWKIRNAKAADAQHGAIVFGAANELCKRVRENGVDYAIDLRLQKDATFYLDTRELRAWAKRSLAGKHVLNTFAYTGTLGVAAAVAPAARVVQTDLRGEYLNLAKQSYAMNQLPVSRRDFIAGDFFPVVAQLRRTDELFDCVFVDPPFFSATRAGAVDLVSDAVTPLNKVRPLIADGGTLVAVNNALFLSGADYLAALQTLCEDGYARIEALIAVPQDITGFILRNKPAVDPAPFAHATKIAVLRVTRKDGRTGLSRPV
jgi:23S rRNA (cytosine1962-C5)-methyltransferase